MWELDHKESWVPKNWCFRIVVLEKTLESPLDNKEIKSVNPKRNQPWILIGRTNAEAEAPILWSPDMKRWLIGKALMLGKIKGQRRGRQRMRWLDGITDLMGMSLSKLWELRTGKPGVLQSMGLQRVGHKLATEQLTLWTENFFVVVAGCVWQHPWLLPTRCQDHLPFKLWHPRCLYSSKGPLGKIHPGFRITALKEGKKQFPALTLKENCTERSLCFCILYLVFLTLWLFWLYQLWLKSAPVYILFTLCRMLYQLHLHCTFKI